METSCLHFEEYNPSVHVDIGFVDINSGNPDSCFVSRVGYTGVDRHNMNLGLNTPSDFCLVREMKSWQCLVFKCCRL